MTDTDIIQSAYADALTKLFSIYFDALATAAGNASTEAEAAHNFESGVSLARRARDQALAYVKREPAG